MRKLRIAAVILIILGGLMAFALMNLGRLVNRNKDTILARAEEVLGRRVAVEDIGVTVWGGIGIRLKNFSLADDKAFSQEDFLRALDLQVNVEFLPLLRKELRVKRLILHQPRIQVIRNKQGNLNLESLGRPNLEKRQKETAGTTPSTSAEALPFLVSLVDLDEGEVRYLDRKDGVDLRVSQIDLTVEDLGYDRPVSINLAAAINAEQKNLKIQGKIGPLRPTGILSDPKDLFVSADLKMGPVALADVKRFTPLGETLPKDLTVDGPVSFSSQVEGTLENLVLKGEVEATSVGITFGDHFRKPKEVPLLISTDARITKKEIALQKTNIRLHTLKLTGSGAITRGQTAVLHLTLDSSRTDLAGWEKILPSLQGYDLSGNAEMHARIQGELTKGRAPDIKGSLTLTDLRATLPQLPQPLTGQKVSVTFTGERAALGETPFRLGNSAMRVTAQVEKFIPLALTYRLSAPELWLADLREGRGPTKRPEILREAKSDGRAWVKNGSISYQGRLSSARGTIADLDYTDLRASLSMANQVVTIESFSLRAYNGSVEGRGQYDMRKTVPHFNLTSTIRGMDVAELFRPTSGTAATHIRGQANLDLNLTGSGNRWEDIQRALTGQGEAVIEKGALLDVNIAEGALTGLTGVPGISQFIAPSTRKKYPAIFATQNTEFGQLKGSINIREGKVHLDDLLMAAADWAVQGKGWVTLDQKLNVRATLALSRQLSTDLIANAKLLKYLTDRQGRLEIPFILAGAFPSVTPKPDIEYVARLVQRGLVEQGVQELFKKSEPPSAKTPQQGQAPPSQQTPPQETPEPRKETPEEKLLKGLKDLFGR